MSLTVRPATSADAAAMAELINAIIAVGGTTAHEDPFTPEQMVSAYISPPDLISCLVAEADGQLLGFQGTVWGRDPDDPLPEGWAMIGTFVRVGLTQGGVGSALFAETLKAARAAGVAVIDATIRADNVGGLAFYARQGFVDYDRLVSVPLKDGRPVDRIRKRLDIGHA